MSTQVSTAKTAGLVAITLITIIGLVVASWFVYWFVALRTADHRAHIRRASFEAQETARVQVSKAETDLAAIDVQLADPNISAAEKTALAAQRKAIAAQGCLVANRIRGGDVPDVVQAFILTEC